MDKLFSCPCHSLFLYSVSVCIFWLDIFANFLLNMDTIQCGLDLCEVETIDERIKRKWITQFVHIKKFSTYANCDTFTKKAKAIITFPNKHVPKSQCSHLLYCFRASIFKVKINVLLNRHNHWFFIPNHLTVKGANAFPSKWNEAFEQHFHNRKFQQTLLIHVTFWWIKSNATDAFNISTQPMKTS